MDRDAERFVLMIKKIIGYIVTEWYFWIHLCSSEMYLFLGAIKQKLGATAIITKTKLGEYNESW